MKTVVDDSVMINLNQIKYVTYSKIGMRIYFDNKEHYISGTEDELMLVRAKLEWAMQTYEENSEIRVQVLKEEAIKLHSFNPDN